MIETSSNPVRTTILALKSFLWDQKIMKIHIYFMIFQTFLAKEGSRPKSYKFLLFAFWFRTEKMSVSKRQK